MTTFPARRLVMIVVATCAGLVATGLAQRITNAVPDAARPLPLSAVRLTGGPLRQAQDLTAAYLLSLEPDRMLAFYRKRAGLEPKAEGYTGWDADGRQLTGHIAGHYLSGVSLMFAATSDPRFKQRADYIVSELKAVQDAQSDGFAGALPGVKEAFAEVSKGNIRSANFDLNGLWSPWYTLHKTYAGLRDAWRHTGNRTALEVEIRFAEWAERVIAPMSDEHVQRMLNTEFGGMNEIFADLYADTGDTRWLALSYRFEHKAVLDPLKRGEDPLDGLHGNTQVPKLLGSAARYRYTGDTADQAAATFFWDRVVRHHTFATGGHGKDEYFREPNRLGNIIDGRTAETCNVYNMLKLTRVLFALKPDAGYAEFQERALFNHILGSIDPGDGAFCYMVPVGRGVRREYQDMHRSFTCCVGSGMESHALHGDGIYYESGDRLWVNLYAPSTATWDAAGVRLDVQTDFPDGESATMTIGARAPKAFTLALRRPAWATGGFRVSVNGAAVTDLARPGSYVELKRTWTTGDQVTLVLPKSLRLEAVPDNRRRAAVLWGPLVLAGDLGPEPERGASTSLGAGPSTSLGAGNAARGARPDAPMLVTSERPVTDWLEPVDGKPGTFRTVGVGRDSGGAAREVELVPFHKLHRRVYAAYWDLFTRAEYEAKTANLAADRERMRALEAATVAFVQPIDGIEKTFNQQGEDTTIVRVEGRPGRRGTKWFSYDVPVDGNTPALVVTYHADNRRARTFQILVDGQQLADVTIPQSSDSRFFDVRYPLRTEMWLGRAKVTVRFQAASGNEIGAVFGVRIIR